MTCNYINGLRAPLFNLKILAQPQSTRQFLPWIARTSIMQKSYRCPDYRAWKTLLCNLITEQLLQPWICKIKYIKFCIHVSTLFVTQELVHVWVYILCT